MCRSGVALLAAAFATGVLSGCGGRGESRGNRGSSLQPISAPLTVLRSHGAVVAFVNVSLDGHPYRFVVDSGSARTEVDAGVARRLGLHNDGSPREFATLGCEVSAQPVVLPSLRLGDASFSSTTVFTQRLLVSRAFSRFHVVGLLGSDFLSRRGAVTIDLTHRRLILGGNAPTRPDSQTVPIRILRLGGGELASTQVELDHQPARFLIDTGAAFSVIDSSAAARLRLQAFGPSVHLTGAVCRTTGRLQLLSSWTLGALHFPEAFIVSVADVLPRKVVREGILGIVGMTTLSRSAALTIDYSHARMTLGKAAPTEGVRIR